MVVSINNYYPTVHMKRQHITHTTQIEKVKHFFIIIIVNMVNGVEGEQWKEPRRDSILPWVFQTFRIQHNIL